MSAADFPIETIDPKTFPMLQEIPDPPPTLTYRGNIGPLSDENMKLLAIVGSRKYTTYAKQVVADLVAGLRGYPVGIVSGLALGVDSLAHRAALDNHLYTAAVPGGGLSDHRLYPSTHKRLAYEILESGGGLLSEFDPEFQATPWSFPQRNRVVAGLCHATLIIEATMKSGTLITARLATEYSRDVLTVPGSIYGAGSAGPHMLLRMGAVPITKPEDLLDALDLKPLLDPTATSSLLPTDLSESESTILKTLTEPTDIDTIIRTTGLDTTTTNIALMQLEIAGHIANENGTVRKLF